MNLDTEPLRIYSIFGTLPHVANQRAKNSDESKAES
jgi:hypothetical protein